MEINKVYLKGQEQARGYNNPNKIIIHHPEWYGDIYSLNNLMRSMGYYMLGYNYYVRKDGSVWQGRPVWATGANCYGQNNCSIGIAFEGNYDKDTSMPTSQFEAGVELIKYLKDKYNINEVGPHYKYSSTECPGKYFPVNDMLSAINGDNKKRYIETKIFDCGEYGVYLPYVLPYFKGFSTYALSYSKNIWIITQYLTDSQIEKLKADLGDLYCDTRSDDNGKWIVTQYLPYGEWGVYLPSIMKYFEGINCYLMADNKEIWFDTQWLNKEECEDLKNSLTTWVNDVKSE